MSFLADYDALTGTTPEQLFEKQMHALVGALAADPAALFAELRGGRPILVSAGAGPVVVSRFTDAVEVLGRDGVFGVQTWKKWITFTGAGANYILGMEDGPEFDNDLSILTLAVKRTDLPRVKALAAESARRAIDAARPGKQLDLADGPARRTPLELSAGYFGVPGPSPERLGGWTRALFFAIFGNLLADPGVADAGKAAGAEFAAYLDGLIAARKAERRAGAADADTVLDRLLDMQCDPAASFPDARIRDNLIGTINGMIDNTNTAVNRAVDVFLSQPAALEGATAAARAGDADALFRHVLEALRFSPPAPAVVRVSNADYVLAKGTPRETAVPAGRLVIVALASAMMDETVLDRPLQFRADRPPSHYLHFGAGMHRCFGRHINGVQIPELVGPILRLPNLRRAPGEAGKLRFKGPFPASFLLNFD